jgi:hypothetical protein
MAFAQLPKQWANKKRTLSEKQASKVDYSAALKKIFCSKVGFLGSFSDN